MKCGRKIIDIARCSRFSVVQQALQTRARFRRRRRRRWWSWRRRCLMFISLKITVGLPSHLMFLGALMYL
jgi:hypothetical protein